MSTDECGIENKQLSSTKLGAPTLSADHKAALLCKDGEKDGEPARMHSVKPNFIADPCGDVGDTCKARAGTNDGTTMPMPLLDLRMRASEASEIRPVSHTATDQAEELFARFKHSPGVACGMVTR